MKNKLTKALVALFAVTAMSAVVACGSTKDPACTHSYADEHTCHDRVCTKCGETLEATTEHIYEDEYSCHDRACTECGETLEATADHTFGEWTTIRFADCENEGLERRECDCGETQEQSTAITGHTYEDDITCHDRTCTTEDCGHVEPASTPHNYGEWEVVTEATCLQNGQDSRICVDCKDVNTRVTTKDHEFDANGVCPMCEKSVKDMFITVLDGESNTGAEKVTADTVFGTYEITTTGENDVDAYAVIPGSVLTALKNLGYTTLTFTVTNPAPGLCDMNDKCKSFFLSADSTANLWSADTAIAYWAWKAFWDAGKKVTFTVDLETYAGHNLYIYTQQCATYPTVIQIAEFIDYANPITYVSAGTNSTLEYIEGKGWQFVAVDATTGKYGYISASVAQYYKAQGKNLLKISFVNSFGLEGSGNEGAPVNTQMAVLPEKVEGGNDWHFCNGYISQVGTLDEESNSYYVLVNLNDERYDFTKDIELYFKQCDVAEKTVVTNYISSIEFIEHSECTYNWVLTQETTCEAVGFETGTCTLCKATTTRALDEELADHSYDWQVTTPANCKEQGVETGICSICGDTQTRATTGELPGHYYEWTETTPGTCIQKAVETGTCTGCGDTQTRDGEFGDHSVETWDAATEATCEAKATEEGACVYCGETQTREVGELAACKYDGVTCTVCGDNLARKLIVNEETADISVSLATGTWTISSTISNAYAKMPGDVLQALYDAGYTKLTMTVVNPAPGAADATEKCKTCYIAADARGNLWSADTAIAFYGWQAFWNNGKTFTVEIDLATYAGHDIYIYSDHNDAYPTQITINELIDYEDPAARLVGLPSDNGAAEYIEGKGWHAYSINGTGAYYVRISGEVVMHYINKGYTSLKLTVVNNMDIGISTEGNSINVQQAILLKNSAGSNDWNYCNGWLSAKWTSENGGYTHTIDLTNTDYDFSKGVTLYFTYTDINSKAVGHTYITGIDFLK